MSSTLLSQIDADTTAEEKTTKQHPVLSEIISLLAMASFAAVFVLLLSLTWVI